MGKCIVNTSIPTKEELDQITAGMVDSELTTEERLSIMEDAFAELCEVIFND